MLIWIFTRFRVRIVNLRVGKRRDFAADFTHFGFIDMILVERKLIQIDEKFGGHKDPEIILLIHDKEHILIWLRLIHEYVLKDGVVINLLLIVEDLIDFEGGYIMVDLFIRIDIFELNEVRKTHLMYVFVWSLVLIGYKHFMICLNLAKFIKIDYSFELYLFIGCTFSFYCYFLFWISNSPFLVSIHVKTATSLWPN